MSIFKQTFSDHIKKQLNTRQKVIASGNKDKNSHSRLYHGFNDLVPGAFYGYQQKQCVIRMASLVDLMKDIDLDLGVTQPDGTRYKTPFNSYKGSTFARNYILEGGVLSDYARNIKETDEKTTTKVRKYDVRGGFPHAGKRVNLSYGDPSLASDPTEDGYGVVPMPGITDANVRTKSAYGSLRQAKVNFVCHNFRQLEILELLYMRPGYPVLMEWGWSPYINNNGQIINDFPSLTDYEEFWNDKKITQEWCYNEIIRHKRETDGNYDGFVGFVSNFNYTSRADGGFDCTTELISMGECLDSLKAPSAYLSDLIPFNASEDEALDDVDASIYQNSLGTIIWDLVQATRLESNAKVETAENGINIGEWIGLALKGEWGTTVEKEGKYIKGIWSSLIFRLGEQVVAEGLIPIGSKLNNGIDTITTNKPFIRWDLLCELLNDIIPLNDKDEKTIILSYFDYTREGEKVKLTPIRYSKYTDNKGEFMDFSCNSDVCILPHQFKNFRDSQAQAGFWGRIGYGAGAVVAFPFAVTATAINQLLGLSYEDSVKYGFGDVIAMATAARTGETDDVPGWLGGSNGQWGRNLQINDSFAERSISNIFINIDFLHETYKNVFADKDATIGDFLKKLWDGIGQACPLHNFTLKTDAEYPNVVQVVDLPIDRYELSDTPYDSLFKFNVLSNDTVVREFKYNTQIPNALKATIAINAQSGHSAEDIEAVTFAAFNQNIKSRLHTYDEKYPEQTDDFTSRVQLNVDLKWRRLYSGPDSLYNKIRIYNDSFFDTLERETKDTNVQSIFTNIKSILKEAQGCELYIQKGANGNPKNSAIIPLNLNLVLDGISNIIIGNVFRIDESRLPKDYRSGNIAFVVLGEDQNITAGQDWTTNIRGQLFLYPTDGGFPYSPSRPNVIERTNFTSARANEVTAQNEQIFTAESTGTNIAIPNELQPTSTFGLGTGQQSDVNNARTKLVGNPLFGNTGEGYTSLVSDNGLYELFQKPLDNSTYQITYIKTVGDDMGLIVDYGIVNDLSESTISEIQGNILATGRF